MFEDLSSGPRSTCSDGNMPSHPDFNGWSSARELQQHLQASLDHARNAWIKHTHWLISLGSKSQIGDRAGGGTMMGVKWWDDIWKGRLPARPTQGGKNSVLTWSRLRAVGKSSAAKVTVLLPLIGYLIIFNKNVADFLQLAAQFTGADQAQFGVAPKLMLVYVGACAIAAGQGLYGLFCPAEVKGYGHVTPYVLDAARVTKDFKYEKLEDVLRASRYRAEYIRMRDRYEKGGSPITEEQKGHINNGVLHLHFAWLDNRLWLARWLTGLCYLLGLVCLLVPSLGVFLRVARIIFNVLKTNISLLF
ncbi:hypothetical protein SAMN05443247_00044 [Bradyrhizobium erythrophlei]|nr:hypothetical protein SAMN05443247_00044 [Bradyrhizobium erythrophlei]